jgi:hypothetical protein
VQTYRLRFERWERGIGAHSGRFVLLAKTFEADNRRAALREASRLWSTIESDAASTRFVDLVEIVGWRPQSERRGLEAIANRR